MPHRPAKPTLDEIVRLRCQTGNYHSVVAISESMLNAQLVSYYNLLDGFKSTNVKHDHYGGINATLNPPKIEIPVRDQNKSAVYFFFCIKEGMLTYFADGKAKELSITGWEIAFSCNLGECDFAYLLDFKLIPETLADLQGVDKADLEGLQKGLNVPGEYSIQRLLINFSEANLSSFNKDRSKMTMADGGKIPSDAQIALGFWIGSWLTTWETVEEHLFDGFKLQPDSRRKQYPLLYHAIAPKPEDG